MPRTLAVILCVVPASVVLGGCVAAALAPAAAAASAASSGVTFWQGNKLRQAIPASAEEVSAALDAELESLALRIEQEYETRTDGGALRGRVVRVHDDDEHVGTVRIERMTERMTYTVMTVRILGKKAAVSLLMERVSLRATETAPERSEWADD